MSTHQEAVYEVVRQLIVDGRIAPGSRLTEGRVALRTGASRTPVRSALQRLAAEGFLIGQRAGRRTELVVTPLTGSDVGELYYSMGALEGVAARAIAELSRQEATKLAADLREANAAFRAAREAAPNDTGLPFDLHNAFHELLVCSCAQQRLRAVIAQLRPHVDRYEKIYAPLVGPPHDVTFAEHDAIAAAVEAGDPDGAERAVAANWRNSAERLLVAFNRTGARGDWLLE